MIINIIIIIVLYLLLLLISSGRADHQASRESPLRGDGAGDGGGAPLPAHHTGRQESGRAAATAATHAGTEPQVQ